MGKPSTYGEAIATEIVERLSGGEPLAHICRDVHMPAVRTVSDWRKAHPEFDERFGHARDNGYDVIAADCLHIADTPMVGTTETSKEWGTEVKKGDMLDHRKLQVDTRLKLLAKWDPRRYGDKQQVEHSGELTVNGLAGRMRQRRAPVAGEDLV